MLRSLLASATQLQKSARRFQSETEKNLHDDVLWLFHVFYDHSFNAVHIGIVHIVRGVEDSGEVEDAEVRTLGTRKLNSQDAGYKVLIARAFPRTEFQVIRGYLAHVSRGYHQWKKWTDLVYDVRKVFGGQNLPLTTKTVSLFVRGEKIMDLLLGLLNSDAERVACAGPSVTGDDASRKAGTAALAHGEWNLGESL